MPIEVNALTIVDKQDKKIEADNFIQTNQIVN
jgi:hypothetical protein